MIDDEELRDEVRRVRREIQLIIAKMGAFSSFLDRIEGSIAPRRVPRPEGVRQEGAIRGDLLLLSVDQAAQLLNCGRTRVFELVASGKLESLKIGKLRRIPRSALDEFVLHLRDGGVNEC